MISDIVRQQELNINDQLMDKKLMDQPLEEKKS
jgi:hypothetical protein